MLNFIGQSIFVSGFVTFDTVTYCTMWFVQFFGRSVLGTFRAGAQLCAGWEHQGLQWNRGSYSNARGRWRFGVMLHANVHWDFLYGVFFVYYFFWPFLLYMQIFINLILILRSWSVHWILLQKRLGSVDETLLMLWFSLWLYDKLCQSIWLIQMSLNGDL